MFTIYEDKSKFIWAEHSILPDVNVPENLTHVLDNGIDRVSASHETIVKEFVDVTDSLNIKEWEHISHISIPSDENEAFELYRELQIYASNLLYRNCIAIYCHDSDIEGNIKKHRTYLSEAIGFWERAFVTFETIDVENGDQVPVFSIVLQGKLFLDKISEKYPELEIAESTISDNFSVRVFHGISDELSEGELPPDRLTFDVVYVGGNEVKDVEADEVTEASE